MKLAVTVVKEATKQAPLALRGDYADTVRQAARSAYEFLYAAVAAGPRA
ncbi:MAG: hypothetical protein ACYCO5_16450 [Acidobacteriaceae bacterium]